MEERLATRAAQAALSPSPLLPFLFDAAQAALSPSPLLPFSLSPLLPFLFDAFTTSRNNTACCGGYA